MTQDCFPITEGQTQVLVTVPKTEKRGPATRTAEPFYNPAMELSRDLSILVNQWFIDTRQKPTRICDGLAASGIRGLRLAKELTGDVHVTINDSKETAFELIQENIQRNSLKNATASNTDLNVLLARERFHSIDIDPFGSPIPFVDSAMRSIIPGGLLACTATDTAPLCGVFPEVCHRRYAAWPLHGPCMHEVGLRILLGVLAREAGKYDKGILPILCYTTDHYIRVYVKVDSGKHVANASMNQLLMIPASDVPLTDSTEHPVGPLWMGPLLLAKAVKEVRSLVFSRPLGSKHQLWKLLSLLEDEVEAPPFFYAVEEIASRLKRSMPPLNHILGALGHEGFFASRTHFTPTGFKTDASWESIQDAITHL
jgi:tRNA (guanine26-N2/guanine27-N2)-dimethyltransferase